MTTQEFEIANYNLQKKQAAFHRHPQVIAARKAYRADLKKHVPETIAWARANARYNVVRVLLGLS